MADTSIALQASTHQDAPASLTAASQLPSHLPGSLGEWVAQGDQESIEQLGVTAFRAIHAALVAIAPISVLFLSRSPYGADTHPTHGDDQYTLSPRDAARRAVIEYFRNTETAYSFDLSAALHDLEHVADEARNDGSPIPSLLAHQNARHLIERMYRICRLRYTVYPLYKGEIVIEAMFENQNSVLVVCRSEGDIGCFVNVDDQSRQERYHDVSGLPNGFLRQALCELMHRGRRAA